MLIDRCESLNPNTGNRCQQKPGHDISEDDLPYVAHTYWGKGVVELWLSPKRETASC